MGSSPTRRATPHWGRLAQRLEHLSYTQGVTGSNPVSPTIQDNEAKTVTTLDRSRTFLSTGLYREGGNSNLKGGTLLI